MQGNLHTVGGVVLGKRRRMGDALLIRPCPPPSLHFAVRGEKSAVASVCPPGFFFFSLLRLLLYCYGKKGCVRPGKIPSSGFSSPFPKLGLNEDRISASSLPG